MGRSGKTTKLAIKRNILDLAVVGKEVLEVVSWRTSGEGRIREGIRGCRLLGPGFLSPAAKASRIRLVGWAGKISGFGEF